MFDKWVLDATLSNAEALCYIPIENDKTLVTGMNFITGPRCLPKEGKVVGVVHLDGQEACDKWYQDNQHLLPDELVRGE
jgi:hypothetical protein